MFHEITKELMAQREEYTLKPNVFVSTMKHGAKMIIVARQPTRCQVKGVLSSLMNFWKDLHVSFLLPNNRVKVYMSHIGTTALINCIAITCPKEAVSDILKWSIAYRNANDIFKEAKNIDQKNHFKLKTSFPVDEDE